MSLGDGSLHGGFFLAGLGQLGQGMLEDVHLLHAVDPGRCSVLIMNGEELFKLRLCHLCVLELIDVGLADVDDIGRKDFGQHLVVHICHLLGDAQHVILTDIVLGVEEWICVE